MIKITDKYYVDADKYNWILREVRSATTEEIRKKDKNLIGDSLFCKDKTYHATITTTLEYLFERRTKDIANESKTLEEYIKKTTKMKKDFCDELRKIVTECGDMFRANLNKDSEDDD